MEEFTDIWGGQGGYIEPTGGYSTPDQAPGRFWDWWDNNGEQATGLASTIFCAIAPDKCRRPPGGYPGSYPQPQQDNTILFVFMGLILLLLVVMIFKK